MRNVLKQNGNAWKAWATPDPALPLEKQLFQGICLLGGVLNLVVVLPVNIFQTSLSPWVNWAVVGLGLELIALSWLARRGLYLKKTTFLSIIIWLDLVWFPNAGSQGSIGLYFFPAAFFLVLFSQGAFRSLGFLLLVANIIALLVSETIWPNLAHAFNPMERLIDLSTGYLLSMLICALMLWVVLEGFNREKRRLADSERLYRELLERQGEGFALVDADERFIFANPLAEQIFGVPHGGLVGCSLLDFLGPEGQHKVLEETKLRAQQIHSTYEIPIRRPDGEARLLRVTATPGRLSPEEPLNIIGVFRDITEETQAERTKQLLEQEKHQAQKMDSLGSLAGGVAHDFNNMLGGIMGYADLLLAGESDPKRQRYLLAITAAASRSAELTRKLLAFGRRGKNLVVSLNMRDAVEECLDMLRPSMSPDLKVIVAMVDCPSVDGDPAQLHQVLVNLCINAMEAMPEGGVLTLAACARELPGSSESGLPLPAGSYVELSVSDTGMGMAEEVRPRIFEPFFTTKDSSGVSGTGLGLATAFGIIQTHRGAITVDSVRGKGSVFRLFLPVGQLSPLKAEAPVLSTGGQGLVLLVEDEPILQDLGRSILDSLGYEVLTAGDGLEAVEVFRRHHSRLCAVLLDLKMPRMAGREAYAEILMVDPKVPVIVCTGFGENEEVQELLTLGAAGMLAKPYRIGELAAMLRQVSAR
ncbi:MAG: response regulator [Holophagaceae bacterium]|uniref:histidine kinase n=1 Tax=Candidatus Geothrix skivensis TaxID=2954439 RepID=A0A9D7SGW8_9BACT|nr:response regulator [Candidatus Geothrix skivensis]